MRGTKGGKEKKKKRHEINQFGFEVENINSFRNERDNDRCSNPKSEKESILSERQNEAHESILFTRSNSFYRDKWIGKRFISSDRQ